MVIVKCDKCKRDTADSRWGYIRMIEGDGTQHDLCMDCYDAFGRWMDGQ